MIIGVSINEDVRFCDCQTVSFRRIRLGEGMLIQIVRINGPRGCRIKWVGGGSGISDNLGDSILEDAIESSNAFTSLMLELMHPNSV